MDMAQSHIGEGDSSRLLKLMGKWAASPVGHQNLNTAGERNLDVFQKRFLNLGGVIAEAVYLRINIFKIYRGQGILHDPGYIGTPGKT